jgi:hypothetical protein
MPNGDETKGHFHIDPPADALAAIERGKAAAREMVGKPFWQLSETASASPTTVTEVSKAELDKLQERKPRKRKPKKNGDIQTVKVNEEVLETAKRLAGGDQHLLEIKDENSVVVHNNPNWREWRKKR